MIDNTHRWGRSALGSHLAHLRTNQRGITVARTIGDQRVGPAVCGAWLVDDIPSPIESAQIRMCAHCLRWMVDNTTGNPPRR